MSEIAVAAGGKLNHVKVHGALYNQAARDTELAAAIAEAVRDFDENLVLFCLSGSPMISEAEKLGLRTASEVFADRTYQPDGSLTPRTLPNALIYETDQAVGQAIQMLTTGGVTTVDGSRLNIRADTICLHSDGENALEFAIAIRRALADNNIAVEAFDGR